MNKAVIFDLDGTLWDSRLNVIPAWNGVFERHGLKRRIALEDMNRIMGKNVAEIGAMLFPEEAEEYRTSVINEVCDNELLYFDDCGELLFPGIREALTELGEKYGLFVVSNCMDGYIQVFIRSQGLEGVFADFECYGGTGLVKGENIRLIMQRNGIDKAVYVGDTAGDCRASALAGVPFIFAGYGFGEVEGCEYVLKSPAELPELIDRVL